MTEGSVYDEELAALAIKQAAGDLVEAIFLLRAYRTTLPRFGYTVPLNTEAMLAEHLRKQGQFPISANEVGSGNYTERLAALLRYRSKPTLRTLATYSPRRFRITVDDTTVDTEAWLVAVGNTRSYASGMMITPAASVHDGLLDVCIVGPVSRPEFLRTFPKVFSGTHVEHPEVLTALRHLPMPKTGWIFRRPLGGPYSPDQLSIDFRAFLDHAGITAKPHQLRHWFASHLYAKTKDLRLVQEMLGHASPTTTAIYVAFDRQQAGKAIGDLSLEDAS